MIGDPTDHEHVWSVSLTGNWGSDDQSWVATCLGCGLTESGDDAPSQIGIRSWSGEVLPDDSEDPPDTP